MERRGEREASKCMCVCVRNMSERGKTRRKRLEVDKSESESGEHKVLLSAPSVGAVATAPDDEFGFLTFFSLFSSTSFHSFTLSPPPPPPPPPSPLCCSHSHSHSHSLSSLSPLPHSATNNESGSHHSSAMEQKRGTLVAIPIKGRKILNRSRGKQSPFIQLKLGDQSKRTKASLIASEEPEWDQEVTFYFPS